MKNILIILIALSFQPVFGKVKWETSFKKGFEIAKKSGKPIFVDVYADWCTYCKVLENKIFPQAKVSAELEKFVTLRIDGEEFPNFRKKFGIDGYPCLLYLDKNGNFLDKVTGLPTAEMVIKKTKAIYEKRDIEGTLLKEFSKNPDGVYTNYKLGVYYYESREHNKAIQYFKKAIASKATDNPEKRHDSLYNLSIIYIDKEDYETAIKSFSQYIETYKSTKGDLKSAYYYRAFSYMKLGQTEKAITDFQLSYDLTTDKDDKLEIQSYLEELKAKK